MKFPEKENEDTKIGKEVTNIKSSGKKYELTFKGNRTFELHIGKKVFRFEGKKTKHIIDDKILNHKDFTDNVKNYLLVKEVK